MAEIDLRFLGERIERLQTEMRSLRSEMGTLRAEQLRLEADQATIRAEMANRFDFVDDRLEILGTRIGAVEFEMKNLERSMIAQFDIVHKSAATNLEIVLTAIQGKLP